MVWQTWHQLVAAGCVCSECSAAHWEIFTHLGWILPLLDEGRAHPLLSNFGWDGGQASGLPSPSLGIFTIPTQCQAIKCTGAALRPELSWTQLGLGSKITVALQPPFLSLLLPARKFWRCFPQFKAAPEKPTAHKKLQNDWEHRPQTRHAVRKTSTSNHWFLPTLVSYEPWSILQLSYQRHWALM